MAKSISDKYEISDENVLNALRDIEKSIPEDRSLFILDKEPTADSTDDFEENKIYKYNGTLYMKFENKILKFEGTEL